MTIKTTASVRRASPLQGKKQQLQSVDEPAASVVQIDETSFWPRIDGWEFDPEYGMSKERWSQLTESDRGRLAQHLEGRGRVVCDAPWNAEYVTHLPPGAKPECLMTSDGMWVTLDTRDYTFTSDGGTLPLSIWNVVGTRDKKRFLKWMNDNDRELVVDEDRVYHRQVRRPLKLVPEWTPVQLGVDSDAVRHYRDVSFVVVNADTEAEGRQKFREWLEDVIACGLAKE